MEKSKIELLSGCVVLYNPTPWVIINITSYISFLDVLFIVDNSDSPDTTLVNEICAIDLKIIYSYNQGNIGIAAALNKAAELALEKKYNWLLTMDQDSNIIHGFFDMIEAPLTDPENIIIAASYNRIFFKPQKSEYVGFAEIGTVITSGNLLNLNGWKKLGGFCEKLFIDEVDNEFCIRAIKEGYKIQATQDNYLDHNLGTTYSKVNILTGKRLNLTRHSPFRLYYMTRNNLFLWKRYLFTNPALVYNRMKNLIKLIYEITFYYPDKSAYYKKIIKGATHFLISKYGKM